MAETTTPCECNSRFVKCLKAQHTFSADILHQIYILNVEKCFLHSWPIQKCLHRDELNRCTRYYLKDGVSKHKLFDQHYVKGDDDDGILTSEDFQTQQRSMDLQHFYHVQQLIPYPVQSHNGFIPNC